MADLCTAIMTHWNYSTFPMHLYPQIKMHSNSWAQVFPGLIRDTIENYYQLGKIFKRFSGTTNSPVANWSTKNLQNHLMLTRISSTSATGLGKFLAIRKDPASNDL